MITIEWENDRPDAIDRLLLESVGHVVAINGEDVIVCFFDGSDVICRRWQPSDEESLDPAAGHLIVFPFDEIESVRFY